MLKKVWHVKWQIPHPSGNCLKDSLKSAGEQVERLNTAVAKRETDLETANKTIQSLQTQTEQLNADTEQMKSLHSKEIEEKIASFDTERDNLAKSSRALEDDIQKLKKCHEAELLKQSEALKESEHEKESEIKKESASSKHTVRCEEGLEAAARVGVEAVELPPCVGLHRTLVQPQPSMEGESWIKRYKFV